MIWVENVKAAVGELWNNRFRSLLTTLGIVIATGSVIAVVSLLDGMTRHMQGFLLELGTDAIWISPDPGDGELADVKLTREDGRAIATRCAAVKDVAPMLQRQARIRYRGREAMTPLVGTVPAFREIRNWQVASGRFFGEAEVRSRAAVCVVGESVAAALEVEGSLFGKKISIADRAFTCIGVLESKGGMLGQDQDNTVLIPFDTALKLYGQRAGDRVLLLAQAADSEVTTIATEEIERLLRQRHQLEEGQANTFRIQTQDQALDFFDKSSQMATVVLAGVVGISLVVGGIGIMNIMLVSVTERTREIGILKALGARDKDILMQFLIEAVVLSAAGGLIGIALGAGGAVLITHFTPLPPASVPAWAVWLGFAFSAGTGVFFGMYPAVKAARLRPIEALRYE